MNKGNYFDIDENGSFVTENPQHCYDKHLNDFLLNFLKNKSVTDFGCGDASYLKNLQSTCTSIKGYDGNPYTEKLTNGLGESLDLSKIQNAQKSDWVISFETGEHIPAIYEDNFVENLCSHCNEGMIISWAYVGQPGEGHINCRNTDYIIDKLYKKKFICDIIMSTYLRDICESWWFKSNLLIFYKTQFLFNGL